MSNRFKPVHLVSLNVAYGTFFGNLIQFFYVFVRLFIETLFINARWADKQTDISHYTTGNTAYQNASTQCLSNELWIETEMCSDRPDALNHCCTWVTNHVHSFNGLFLLFFFFISENYRWSSVEHFNSILQIEIFLILLSSLETHHAQQISSESQMVAVARNSQYFLWKNMQLRLGATNDRLFWNRSNRLATMQLSVESSVHVAKQNYHTTNHLLISYCGMSLCVYGPSRPKRSVTLFSFWKKKKYSKQLMQSIGKL